MTRWLGLMTLILVLLISTSAASAANGSWSVVSSPNPSSIANDLSGVACTSQTNCWAVGATYASQPQQTQTLIEHWDGSNWTVATVPTVVGNLAAVACSSSTACYAVGQAGDTTAAPLIERWNGTSWTVVSSGAIQGDTNVAFTGVACPTASTCWATGVSGEVYELVSGDWQPVSTPGSGAGQAVDCLSSSDCWDLDPTSVDQWSGSTWSAVKTPTATGAGFRGIGCFSATECWIAGVYYSGKKKNHTLMEKWNGSAWKVVTSASVKSKLSYLDSVVCETATACWAFGGAYDSSNDATTPVNETLTSSGWKLDTTAVGPSDGGLLSSTCSGNECWAVGYTEASDNPGDQGTLIEQRTN